MRDVKLPSELFDKILDIVYDEMFTADRLSFSTFVTLCLVNRSYKVRMYRRNTVMQTCAMFSRHWPACPLEPFLNPCADIYEVSMKTNFKLISRSLLISSLNIRTG